MKMLKKLAALVLAGTMVLLLFTACGGDSAPSPEAQAEAQMMTTINAGRAKVSAQSLNNDPQLREVANRNIQAAADNELSILSYTSKIWFDVDRPEKGKVIVTFVSQFDYKDTKLDSLLQKLTEGNHLVDIDLNHIDDWTQVGVVVKTVKGQTYIAVSVAVDAGK